MGGGGGAGVERSREIRNFTGFFKKVVAYISRFLTTADNKKKLLYSTLICHFSMSGVVCAKKSRDNIMYSMCFSHLSAVF
jgi:hypothetical protein